MAGFGGKKTVGICDRCGFRYKLSDLRSETVDSKNKRNRVCKSCYDQDHPQYKVGRRIIPDPLPVYDPRPDTAIMESRSLGGFNPLRGNSLRIEAGSVWVSQ